MDPMYDRATVKAHAASLLELADGAILIQAVTGAIVGALAGSPSLYFSEEVGPQALAVGIPLLLGGLIGRARGMALAANLRSEAYQLLCLVQIETNTTPAPVVTPKTPAATPQVKRP